MRGRCTGALVVALVVSLTGPASAAPDARQARIIQDYDACRQRMVDDLRSLAARCELNGQSGPAQNISALADAIEDGTAAHGDLPPRVQPPLSPSLPREELAWQAPLHKLRSDYATELYRLARLAINAGMGRLAFQLVHEVAAHNPDHEQARRLLGYVRVGDEWTTPFSALMRNRGNVWHDRFGWLPADHVERYEAGERFFRGRWLTAEKEAAIRTNLANGWIIESEHFRIRTNRSLERGVELSQKLEHYYDFFHREFADFFNTPQQVQKLFEQSNARALAPSSKYEIWYLRTREEFITLLRNKQPGVEGINGVYIPSDRRAYFFDNPDDPEANEQTLYHEVTHQFLSESSRTTFDIATDADFWVIEGIACYMESFDPHATNRRTGDPRHIRLLGARLRIQEDWFIPLRDFTSVGMREFQWGVDFPTLQKYYSQATGVTHFCLHYDNGRYRDGFISYLSQIYSADRRIRLSRQNLAEALQTDFDTLDREYIEYIRSFPPVQLAPAGN